MCSLHPLCNDTCTCATTSNRPTCKIIYTLPHTPNLAMYTHFNRVCVLDRDVFLWVHIHLLVIVLARVLIIHKPVRRVLIHASVYFLNFFSVDILLQKYDHFTE